MAAVKFVCDHAAEYGLDASRMAIMGESAGGFLTEFAATTLGTDYLRACVAFYSPSDLATLSEQNDVEHGGKDVNFMDILSAAMPGVLPEGEKMEEMLLQERIGTEAFREKAKAVSPAYRVSDRTPPTLLLHGTGDKAPAAVLTLRLAAQATGDYSRAELNKYGRLTWTDAAQAQIDAAKNA